MRRKCAGMYYCVKKTSKGYVWTLYDETQVKVQSSLENEDEDDQYLTTKTAARRGAVQEILEFKIRTNETTNNNSKRKGNTAG